MSSLSHHGIKGQRWGVRRYQNKDGTRTAAGKAREDRRVLKKGSMVYRVHAAPKDYVYDNKKYVSTNMEDHNKWADYFGNEYAIRWKPVYYQRYKTKKDLYVATGKDIVDVVSTKLDKQMVKRDLDSLEKEVKLRGYDWDNTSKEDHYSMLLGAQKESGKQIVHELQKMGFGAIEDDHGKNVAKDPVIVLDPDKKLRRYGKTAKDTRYLESYRKAFNEFFATHTSIGGTMYIEGNTLILGDSSYLEHHGILGQKWGVRRFQNKDGTRTAAGKDRDQKNAAKTVKNAKLFRASANAFQGTKFGYGANKRALKEEKAYGDMAYEILNKGKNKAEYDDLSRDINAVASFEYEEYSKKKDAMIEINARISLEGSGIKNPNDEQVAEEWAYWADFDEDWGSDLKGNSYDRYLVSKGYNPNEIHKRYKDDYAKLRDLASKDAEEYLGPYGDTKITYKDKYTKEIVKTTAKEELANKIVDEATMWIDDYGAAQRADLVYTDKELSEMRAEDAKYSPLKHSALFIEDGTLYLSHHGIRGQRWGVRRFQNRDGSLTNAGRKRLGYATKGVTQTVGKAFKAGVKAGGNAVKAVKAHHEKAEAKKKEKKKEKASKTRIGVMANKDLFTNEEIRKLNERFKLEDEMKMATLQKGVEIAKAVGTIAQNVGTMAKAYEDVTGQSLSPIKRKAAEEKAKQDAEDRKRKLAKEDAETKRAEDKEKRDIEDRERRIKLEDEDRARKQAKEDADAQRAENAEKRAQAKEQRDSSMAVELQRKAKAAADEQEHKAVKAKAESRSAILDVLEKIDNIQDHDDDDHNNPPGGGIDTWDDDDYLNFFKKTGIIHSDISDPLIIQNGVLFVDSSGGLVHHGVKGQRWGVRRFQNENGSLTDKGRKHYEKALAKEKRKQASSDAIRGTLERQHPFAVTGSAILGAVAAGMSVAATGGASVAMIAAGSAISAAVSAGLTHATYSVSEAWEGRGTRMRSKKIAKYEKMLKQSSMEEGMYYVENGTLFIDATDPYLEHHGVLGMKWGKHLRAGKGPADAPASAGGGGGEDDEKLKEMAKKAGMSVAEYRTKMAGKLGGAASKVGEKVYDAAGGKHKKNAEGWRKMAQEESNAARASERSSHDNSARAASQDRKYGSGGDVYRRAADSDKENAETHRSNAKGRSERAASEQAAYEKSLAGKYDKMKADRARSKKMKRRQSIERALSNGPVEAKPKKSLGKRLEEKLGVTHEKTRGKKQSKEAKRIEGMFKDAARQDKAFSGTSPKEKKRVLAKRKSAAIGTKMAKAHGEQAKAYSEQAKAYSERAKAKKEAAAKAKVPKMNRDPKTPHPFGSTGVREQDDKINSWADDINRNNKMTRSGWRRKANYEMPKKDFEKAAQDIHNGKKNVTLSEGAAAYALAREQQAVRRRRHSATIGSGDEKKAKEIEARAKREKSIANRYSKVTKRSAKKAKHFDDTNAIYTEGTRLVVNSKWG